MAEFFDVIIHFSFEDRETRSFPRRGQLDALASYVAAGQEKRGKKPGGAMVLTVDVGRFLDLVLLPPALDPVREKTCAQGPKHCMIGGAEVSDAPYFCAKNAFVVDDAQVIAQLRGVKSEHARMLMLHRNRSLHPDAPVPEIGEIRQKIDTTLHAMFDRPRKVEAEVEKKADVPCPYLLLLLAPSNILPVARE